MRRRNPAQQPNALFVRKRRDQRQDILGRKESGHHLDFISAAGMIGVLEPAAAGRLDALTEEALSDLRAGGCTDR